MRALLHSPNRIVALALGIAFAGYGLFSVLADRPLLAALFTVAATTLVVGSLLGIAPARGANIVIGTAWLVLGYAGLFLVGTDFNVVGLTALDEVALFASATVHLAVGLGARRDTATASDAPPTL
ncbi:DUF4383 domain-containing protein [Pseudolysinimonas sp.]|uniref:DUF4383 domain-containing protein n=1 Tax=Pseudolysinimonas sp. TaxID=2680009 RepID=UPI002869F23E|nr:DUF4383 domain-containing protein [Pseudolysinimonas sp.]